MQAMKGLAIWRHWGLTPQRVARPSASGVNIGSGGFGMRFTLCALILLATLSLKASANDLNGTWKAVFIGPIGERPKMVSEMVFTFQVDGNKLTGDAHIANWPGDVPISDGKIDGDRISFMVIGKLPWTSRYGHGPTTSGYPKLVFNGTMSGHEMKIILNWGSILTSGEEHSGRDLDMKAKKVLQ
jgi:hypothetical protein